MLEKTSELAEILGIMTGDGGIYFNKKHDIYQTTVSGHLIHEWDYLVNYVKPLFKNVLGFNFSIRKPKLRKNMKILNQNKELVLILEGAGLKRGKKVKNNTGVPNWILEDDDFIKSFIRGLIDTDGSVYRLPGRKHPCISLKSAIPKLRDDFITCMKRLEIRTTKWTFGSEIPQIYIYDRQMVKRFRRIVGFKNTKHIKRYASFMKAPIV